MAGKSITVYDTATIVGAVLAVIGVWLPWVRKRPVGYMDGQPYYTSEHVWGSATGISGLDPAVIFLVVAVVAVIILTSRRNWQLDVVVVSAGALLLCVFGYLFYQYWSGERYVVESGLYFLLMSGLIFALIGADAILQRRVITGTDDNLTLTD